MYKITNKGPARRISYEGGAERLAKRQSIETNEEQFVEAAKLYPRIEVTNLEEVEQEPVKDEETGEQSLSDLTVKQLKQMVKDRGIKVKLSGLKKDELIELLS